MKVVEFDYIKKNLDKTHRTALILNEKDTYIDAVDFGHLSPEEISKMKEVHQRYETDMKPFIEKAFRRFSKSGIDNLMEEKNE